MLEKILLAVDESEHARKVVSAAAELARAGGGTVHVLHVHEVVLASASSRDGDRMTATEVVPQTTRDPQRDQRTGRILPAAVAVAGLRLATALSSLFAPDLISASQDHVPIVAITIWPWGAVATGFVLFGAAFPTRDRMARWGLTVAVLGIWARSRS